MKSLTIPETKEIGGGAVTYDTTYVDYIILPPCPVPLPPGPLMPGIEPPSQAY